uniref:Si:dkey-205h13.2 n=1 Tax=Sinocyclocheilus rhinocerous TaxID=307959 RepID=A0A673N032_9TELE
DYETLSLLLIRYPLQVCTQPIAIEVTTISGTPVLPPGNIFQVWFDSDNPNTNGGDSELLTVLLSVYHGYICPNPLGIEAQTISGQPAIFQTILTETCFLICLLCADYKVRFTCPEDWCSSECMTPWFDRDNPGGLGDYETLSLTLITYPLQVCAQPIAIEVATISGTPVLPPGNNFQVFDPLQGFECVNNQQGGGVCQDYKVRYTCLKSFCKIQVLSNLTIEAANILDKY